MTTGKGGIAPERRQRKMSLADAHRRATLWLERYGVDPLDNPIAEFEAHIAKLKRLEEFWATECSKLHDAGDLRSTSDTGAEQERTEARWWRDVRQELHSALHIWNQLGLEDRRVRVTEAQAALAANVTGAVIAEVLTMVSAALADGVLDAAYLSMLQSTEMPRILSSQLELVRDTT